MQLDNTCPDKTPEETTKIIKHAIMRLLARRDYSVCEILAKLKQKDLPIELTLPVIKEFQEANLQSDERYSQALVRGAYNKGKGPAFIRRTLQQNNVEPVSVDAYMLEERFDWYELAKQVRQKQFGETQSTDFNEQQKQKRFLYYRGFDDEQIRYAVYQQ